MLNTCILVADRARARLFELAPPPENRASDPARLLEREALVDPEGEVPVNPLFSDPHRGTNHARSGASYEYDEHREQHRQEVARRFAKRIAVAAADFARSRGTARMILAAEPHMLGLLRDNVPRLLPKEVALVELARDLSWHSPEHIRDVLLQHGLLAAPAA